MVFGGSLSVTGTQFVSNTPVVGDGAGLYQFGAGTTPLTEVTLQGNTAADNYHGSPSSPPVNNGLNVGVTLDFEGDARPLGSGFDIGFDEDLLRRFVPVLFR